VPACPLCGAEVEYFTKKPRSHFVQCPACGKKFSITEHPELKDFIKVVEEGKRKDEGAPEEREEEGAAEVKEVKPVRRSVPKPLFEEPKPMEEVIYEVLSEWNCDEDFINRIVNYVQRKQYFDPGWLMNMLLHARTGRKFTEQEAYMVVDEIVSAIEQEKRRAEQLGRPYFGSIIWAQSSSRTYQPGYPMYPATGSQPAYPTTYPPATPTGTPPSPAYQYQQQMAITPQQIREWIAQSLAEQRKESVIDELRRQVAELEKKRIEDKADLEKKLMESITKTKEELINAIKDAISSLAPAQQVQPAGIDKKDIELMKVEMEKAFAQRVAELEKKYLEARSESEKKELLGQIEELRRRLEDVKREASAITISPEGWKSDEARLVAELGGRFLDLVKDRKPMEYLVRIIPQTQAQPSQQQPMKTEKSLEDLIRETGGEVE